MVNVLIVLYLELLAILFFLIKMRVNLNLELGSIFLGYSKGVKGHRLWDRSLTGMRIVIIRDVMFDESEVPCMDREEQQDIVRKKSPIEMEQVSVHIPITLCEVKTNTHNQRDIEGDEEIVKDNPIDEDLYLTINWLEIERNKHVESSKDCQTIL